MKKYIDFFKTYRLNNAFRYATEVPTNYKTVSFTFDDAPKSAFTLVQNILNAHQIKGTYYVSLSFLDTFSENKNLYDKEDLLSCRLNGHELACHTFGHVHFNKIKDQSTVETEILKNTQALKKVGIDATLQNFAYPYGEQTLIAKKIVSQYFNTCRGINQGINSGMIDANNLKAIKLYEQVYSLDKIYAILEELAKNGGWLIFYTHDVQPDYSKFGCSVEYLEKVINKCVELGVMIKPVNEVALDMGITKAEKQLSNSKYNY